MDRPQSYQPMPMPMPMPMDRPQSYQPMPMPGTQQNTKTGLKIEAMREAPQASDRSQSMRACKLCP